jgi:UDP-galactopyranose mutase
MLREKEFILGELSRLPKKIDMLNFKTCVVSMIGETLYKKFIENYTFKFWGISPEELDAEWAPKKIEIRKNDDLGYFNDEWQGLPSNGYQSMFEEMIRGIPVHCNCGVKGYAGLDSDLAISTMPIDELFEFCYGVLNYRGIDFTFRFDEYQWEDLRYGCINYPENNVAFTRRCNYSLCYKNGPVISHIVGYEFPAASNRMYPVYTAENKMLFDKYLNRLVRAKNILSIGRLGLFRYYDMDEAVKWCLDNIEAVENYPNLSIEKKMELLTRVD